MEEDPSERATLSTASTATGLNIKQENDTSSTTVAASVEKTVTECVDVYLLAPEDDRAVELKDFTIMKPKNNKMHRLVRYYPRCEISYRAVPPPAPEEKVVTSPNGTHTTTILTTHRHNGGFSNPSRNAEVFRLKRRLLKEYYVAMKKNDPSFFNSRGAGGGGRGGGAGENDELDGEDQFPYPVSYNNNTIRSTYRRPTSPVGWGPRENHGSSEGAGMQGEPSVLSLFPRYRRFVLEDEDDIALTSELQPRMAWKARINYISSLWPDLAPVDDDEDIMDYYGLEVQIISEEERKKELLEAAAATATTSDMKSVKAAEATTDLKQDVAKGSEDSSPVKQEALQAENDNEEERGQNDEEGEDDDESGPEMTVETRSAAKLKDTEPKMSLVATKQDDWVQCDKCSKWRRLPNHVNVSELPATWYCKMNRWDKRFNKCSAPEEKVVVPMKELDLVEFRERKFVQDFLQRIKRMEKAVQQYKYTDHTTSTTATAAVDLHERQVVQCVECLKKRPLIAGMDARKIAQPFVCWMNSWDEMHASCSAPQGVIPLRHYEVPPLQSGSAASEVDEIQAGSSKKSSSGSASNPKKPSTSHSSSSSSKPPAKRRVSDASSSAIGSENATSSAKKPKRR